MYGTTGGPGGPTSAAALALTGTSMSGNLMLTAILAVAIGTVLIALRFRADKLGLSGTELAG